MIRNLLVFLCLCSATFVVAASDQQRELDYADSIQRNLVLGKVVWLQAGGQSFLSLYTEAEKTDNSNAAIILHDRGDHPDHEPLIRGLRTILPQHNWTTLALQLPLRESGAEEADYDSLADEAKDRLLAGVEYLRKQGAKNIAVIGYGWGAAIAVYTMSAKPDAAMALAAVSLAMPESSLPQTQSGGFMKNITVPILDLYAEFDLPPVVDSARQRRMITKDNPVYRQLKIDGENHTYQYDSGMVVKRIYSWLIATAATE